MQLEGGANENFRSLMQPSHKIWALAGKEITTQPLHSHNQLKDVNT